MAFHDPQMRCTCVPPYTKQTPHYLDLTFTSTPAALQIADRLHLNATSYFGRRPTHTHTTTILWPVINMTDMECPFDKVLLARLLQAWLLLATLPLATVRSRRKCICPVFCYVYALPNPSQ